MFNQALFDEVADLLVEQGVRVTYDALNEALKERDRRTGGPGQGKSDRDLQKPFSAWKRRRRYRPHFAHLDLPDAMEKAIAGFVAQAMAVASKQPGSSASAFDLDQVPGSESGLTLAHQLGEFSAAIQAQMSAVVEECRALRSQISATASVRSDLEPTPDPKREDRRRGLAAATGRFFWDRMMQVFAEAIRERGPMSASELIETLDEDAHAMAKAAFEEVTVSLVKEKVEFRIKKGNYFRATDDGRYDLLQKHAARAKRSGNR